MEPGLADDAAVQLDGESPPWPVSMLIIEETQARVSSLSTCGSVDQKAVALSSLNMAWKASTSLALAGLSSSSQS